MSMVIALALACSGGVPDVPDGPPLPFDHPSAPPPLRLDALPAALTLASTSLPAGDLPDATFDLPEVSPVPLDDDPDRAAWVWPLPFQLPVTEERFAPPGMAVLLDGVPVPYDISPYAPGRTGWRIKSGSLHVVTASDAVPRAARVHHPTLAAEVRRLEPSLAGLAPEAFTRFTWTRDGLTRPGLLLPAPSSAALTLTLPAGARFRAYPDIVTTALSDARSDGARASVAIEVDGRTREASRVRVVEGGLVPGRWPWSPPDPRPVWEVDLSQWAGREVTLHLRVTPDGDPAFDWVFLGAPVIWGAPEAPPRRVLVIALDTTRPDHLGAHGYGRATSPALDDFAEQAHVFERAWAPAPRTRPSFRAALTGRHPLAAVGAPNLAEVLREHAFATAGFAANIHLHPRFDFERGSDLWVLDPSARAADQVDRALAWLDAHRDRDTYTFVHVMDPHLHYVAPAPWGDLFVSTPSPPLPEHYTRWDVARWGADGRLGDAERQWIVDRYDGEIAYTSHEVGRLLEGFAALGGRSLVVVMSDHGEEFWEHGGFEHNHTLHEEVTRAVLWVRSPDGTSGQRHDEPVTLADIAPTVFDYAGVASPPPTDGRSLRPRIDDGATAPWDRALPLGFRMYDVEQWGVLWRDHKYILETMSGAEYLFDLIADPDEQTDRAGEVDLAPWRDALARAHDMPVGPGWRVHLELDGPDPLTWELPAEAISAAIIDPEAGRGTRANLAWGESPDARPDDVGTVTLGEDRRSLTLTPGSLAEGTLQVRFDRPVSPGGTLRRGAAPIVLSRAADGAAWAAGAGTKLAIRPGVVLEPPMGEAARMTALRRVEDADGADLELLKALGYLGDD